MIPQYYKDKPEASWQPWDGGEVFHEMLSIAQRVCAGHTGVKSASINGLAVYALKMPNPTGATTGYASITTWTVDLGWRPY